LQLLPDPSGKKMKALIRKFLTGNIPVREYATVTVPGEINELVYLEINNRKLDVTKNQWVFCLEPLVFGIWVEDEQVRLLLLEEKKCKLIFYNSDSFRNKTAVANLEMRETIKEADGMLFLMALTSSNIHALGLIKTQILFRRYYKKPGLSFKKLKSFVTAYSYPRKVRLISFKSGDHYNIFPMDLIGELRSINRVGFGLRHTNRTLSRIIEEKKIVASEISYDHKNTIYNLGSHHSSAPPSVSDLPFKVTISNTFGFYVPEWAASYKEIKIIRTIDLGSHMLLWGEIVNETVKEVSVKSLYHIHFLHYLHQKKKGIDHPLV
jgi:flavin reductase (DIM6/NTAB) family NADH-FMN oxidoreductase RutF